MEKPEFKVNNFDLLRLIAATQVIFDHYFNHFHIHLTKTQTEVLYFFPGVPMFFVMSGYLISASYERNSKFSNYLKNRILRIFPGLWGVVFFTIIVISVTGVSFFNKEVIAWLPSQLVGIIYTPHFLDNYGFGSYNGSLWTIPVELQFYIFLPLFYIILPKKNTTTWFTGLIVLFIILNLAYQLVDVGPKLHKVEGYTFVPFFYLFLTGVVFQRLRIFNAKIINGKALYWLIGYIIFCLTIDGLINPILFTFIKNGILAFTVLSMAYTLPKTAENTLRNNDISYGIYIYHGLIITVIIQEKWQNNVNVFEIIACAYVLAYLSWTFIEKPFIKRKKQTIKEKVA